MSDTVQACPECDSAVVYERADADPAWICYECDAEFDEPVERPSRAPGVTDSADAEEPQGTDSPTPTVGKLDTPDAVFEGVEPGAKLAMADYQQPFTLMDVRHRIVWDVPFGEDWVDAEVIVTQGAGLSGTGYRAAVTSAGEVDLYRPHGDDYVREAEKHITSAHSVEHVGEISTAAKLQLLGDGVAQPEGDDSWQQYYREERRDPRLLPARAVGSGARGREWTTDSGRDSMSIETDNPDDPTIFEELYERHGDAYEELAVSDNPAAPLAQMVVDEATGEDDA
ncbi:hypothetical protein ACFQL0_21275 [Haloplanus litoreus]|uniref:hypothetical protein n=1 Tax=Haloplanus litoreus TaxID=767515 RepID=UPI003606A9B8